LPTITLKGASRSFWYSALGPWKDPGAMCEDVFDGELPASAVTTMPTSATAGDRFARAGNHKIQYMCHNGDGLKAVPVWREVITMEEPPVDASPILELQGDNPFIWTIESLPKSKGPGVSKVYFPDPGATCFDPNLGDVDFAVSNLADIEKVGEHSVLYTCTADKNGKMATIRRTVVTTDKRPFIKLRGPDLDYSLLDAGGAFEYDDPGAQCFDPDGKEIDGAISIQNQEAKKRHVVGVKYSCMDKEGRSAVPKFRRVVMKRLGKAKPKPVLKLIGKPIDYQPLFQKMYVDLGAKCNDDVDGNDIDYTATMPDLEVPGRHVITYTCTNSRGGTALLRRVVIVGPVVRHTRASCPRALLCQRRLLTRACSRTHLRTASGVAQNYAHRQGRRRQGDARQVVRRRRVHAKLHACRLHFLRPGLRVPRGRQSYPGSSRNGRE
jgi:hypothetical protein